MNTGNMGITQDGVPAQTLVSSVMELFVDLLVASGAPIESIQRAAAEALSKSRQKQHSVCVSHLGSVLRDCMEIMCAWRRHPEFVDHAGEPAPLDQGDSEQSFLALCRKVRCKNEPANVLSVLVEFGAVVVDANGRIVSQTPTFITGNSAGGRLAVDGVIHQLAGFLKVVHQNVCSVSGAKKPRFERACSVNVAVELEPIFDGLVRARGQEFIDSIDEWLERHAKYVSPTGCYIELGAGAYFINFEDSPARSIS